MKLLGTHGQARFLQECLLLQQCNHQWSAIMVSSLWTLHKFLKSYSWHPHASTTLQPFS